jgi:ATP-dependent DNA helicase PIF1
LGDLIRQTTLILWDEAPMVNRYAFEALDRTLRDVCPGNTLMGGKVCVFAGDWRQILPIIPNGTRGQSVAASLTQSPLWNHVHVLNLSQNMRVRAEEIEFAEWLIHVGEGTHENFPKLEIPPHLRLTNSDLPSLIDQVYSDLIENIGNATFFKDRVILATTNDVVDKINDTIVNMVGNTRSYSSLDSVVHDDINGDEDDNDTMYPLEFLNSLSVNGLPPHQLKLSIGSVVVLLRNIDKSNGLCNGTRMIITGLGQNVIQAQIITGSSIGLTVLIPRIHLSSSDNTLPFKLRRTQFPVKLAFAMTINKSQGQTFTRVGISLMEPVFTHGQLYVALSRVTMQDQLFILLPPGKTYTWNQVYQEALILQPP